jgi:hypothetical protein
MKIKHLLFTILSSSLLFACSSNSTSSDDDFIQSDSIIAPESLEISKESMDDLIDNVSSPIEIASLLIDENVPFNKDYIAPTDYIDDLITDFDCALNLGILGTDLGYLNLYEKTGSVMSTVAAINELASRLKVGQFFDFVLLKRLATNSNNLDSLIFTSISSFNNMDDYLRSNNRTNVSALIVSGVWIESTFLATQVYQEKSNEKIAERIGEQKLILNNLVLILSNYKSDPRFTQLLKDFNELKRLYKDVQIVTVESEPVSKVENGMLVIIQTSESKVLITDAQIKEIGELVASLREKYINKKNA